MECKIYLLHDNFVHTWSLPIHASYTRYNTKHMDAQDGKTESTFSTIPNEKPIIMDRPGRTSVVPVRWSVRGVDAGTRRVIE